MKQTSAYQILLTLSLFVNAGLIVAIIFTALRKSDYSDIINTDVCTTGQSDIRIVVSDNDREWETLSSNPSANKKARKPKQYENVFKDLTKEEIWAVLDYMYKVHDLGLVKPYEANVTDNSILFVELYVPNKAEVLAYLSGNSSKPLRQAKVVTLEPLASPPRVMEYVVTPLPNPTMHFPNPRRVKQVSW